MKNTTPAERDPLLSALVLAGLALEALALLLRPVLAHAIAAALLLAGWRPSPRPTTPPATKSEPAKPKTTGTAFNRTAPAKRRAARPVPIAA